MLYAATVHKAQGITVDRAHVLASGYMDRHGAYTGLTRHRDGVALHWGRDEFADAAALARVLGRERAKDTSLDYGAAGPLHGEADQVPGRELAQGYAARRGLAPEGSIVVRPRWRRPGPGCRGRLRRCRMQSCDGWRPSGSGRRSRSARPIRSVRRIGCGRVRAWGCRPMADGMERQGPGQEHEDGEADAAAAFEALRAEVAALRRGVELIYRQQQEATGAAGPAPVDYSPTLGGMAKTLRAVEGRLQAIEGKPAMALTPARFEADIRAAGHWAGEQGGSAVRMAASALTEAKREFEGVLGGVRTAREQRARMGTAALLGLLGGVLLWFMAALVPWGVGHRLAAALVDTGGRWKAGEMLMYEADPEAWDRQVRLSKACPPDTLIELCEAAMVVRTIPPGPAVQPTPEAARTVVPPAVAPPPSASRGRTGTGR